MHARRAALLVFALILAACSDGDDGERAAADDPAQYAAENLDEDAQSDDDAAPTSTVDDGPLDSADIPGEPINQYELSVRDCFDQVEARLNGQPTTVTTRIACENPHHFEVFAQLQYPAEHPSLYPGDKVVREYALASCYQEFAAWVGREYEVSDLEIGVIIPTRESFENDAARYRGIHCWVQQGDGEPMVGTSRNSGW